MTSKDSLIESARPISEDRARIEAALKVAHATIITFDGRAAWSGSPYRSAIVRIIEILDGGRT